MYRIFLYVIFGLFCVNFWIIYRDILPIYYACFNSGILHCFITLALLLTSVRLFAVILAACYTYYLFACAIRQDAKISLLYIPYINKGLLYTYRYIIYIITYRNYGLLLGSISLVCLPVFY